MTNPDKQMPEEIYVSTRAWCEILFYDDGGRQKAVKYIRADLVEKMKDKSK